MTLTKEHIIEFGKAHGYNGEYIYLRHQDVARVIDELIHQHRLKSAINLGCGLGIMEQFLGSQVELTGIDVSREEIALAQALAHKNNKPYMYHYGDIYSFTPNQSSDMVIASEIIEHLPDDRRALHAMKNFLNPSGFLVISVPNRLQPRNRLRALFGLPLVVMDKTHEREYAFEEVESLCQETGFNIVKWAPSVLYFPLEKFFRHIIPPSSGLRKKILHIFPKIASHFIFVLQEKN